MAGSEQLRSRMANKQRNDDVLIAAAMRREKIKSEAFVFAPD
jgi:hypothetical protein